VANALRSIGEKERSLEYYKEAEAIYRKELSANDMLVAGLYNNFSLLYQELNDYEQAEAYLLQALEIVKHNQAGFEIAVTYANLANTCVLGKQYDKAKGYANQAIECFKARNLYDAHYCAALSALGMCYYQEHNYEQARDLFVQGMDIIENSLGRNFEYEKLKENAAACEKMLAKAKNAPKAGADADVKEPISGLELCRRYYETYGKPMIETRFAEFADKIAVGLVGEGSDCMGYDDAISTDHDWGPDFCIWVTNEVYEQIGTELEMAYEALPTEFLGYRRTTSSVGQNRRGVMTISGFYKRLLGASTYEEINWSQVEEYALCAAVDGAVFRDDEGVFTKFREQLKQGYPEHIRYRKLAQEVALLSQCGQYNYGRMRQRGDTLTADRMLSDCIGHAMHLQHHIAGVYAPHDKWLYQSTLRLAQGDTLCQMLGKLHACMNDESEDVAERVFQLTEQLGAFFAKELYAMDAISDISTYLDWHTEELLDKADSATHTDAELVDAIAELEFEAFDKVKNEGGRAYCQNDWPTFSVMRKSQYLTWNRTMLIQYLYDFRREYRRGHNLITEKYGRMMESTAPERYEEIKEQFPAISAQKKAVIEQIVAVQMEMMEAFAKKYPKIAGNARSLHTYEDDIVNTSYETYLRGEISTYSDKMLQLYGRYVATCASEGVNIAHETIANTARLYGYDSIEELERKTC
jgi:tetratricopeptide (TPR) repeat protein